MTKENDVTRRHSLWDCAVWVLWSRHWEEFSFSKILVKIGLIFSCSTLKRFFLLLVIVSKHKIDRNLFLKTLARMVLISVLVLDSNPENDTSIKLHQRTSWNVKSIQIKRRAAENSSDRRKVLMISRRQEYEERDRQMAEDTAEHCWCHIGPLSDSAAACPPEWVTDYGNLWVVSLQIWVAAASP